MAIRRRRQGQAIGAVQKNSWRASADVPTITPARKAPSKSREHGEAETHFQAPAVSMSTRLAADGIRGHAFAASLGEVAYLAFIEKIEAERQNKGLIATAAANAARCEGT